MRRSLHILAGLAVLSVASSAPAAPQVVNKVPVESAFVKDVSTGDHHSPALAADENGNFLGVFRSEVKNGTQSYSYLHGARVSPDGTVIDSAPFVIAYATAAGELMNPRVAYNGGKFLVAWETAGKNIQGAFVDAATNGVPQPFSIAATSRRESEVDVAGIADRFVAVYTSEYASDSDVYATDVFLDGTVSAPYPVFTDFGQGMEQVRRPAIAASPHGFLYLALSCFVADEPSTEFARNSLIFIRTKDADPRIIDDAWTIDGSPVDYSYYCSLVGRPDIAAGEVEGAAVGQFVCKDGKTHQEYARGIYASAPEGKGPWLMPVSAGSHDYEEYPSIAFIDRGLEPGYWITWLGRQDYSLDVMAQKLDPSGSYLVGGPLSFGQGNFATQNRHVPAIASNGGEVLVAWDDDNYGSPEAAILGTRITATGTLLDFQEPLILNQHFNNTPLRQRRVAVARNENNRALAVWHQGAVIRGAVIDLASGQPGATFDIGASTTGITQPAVASDGRDFFVVWENPNNPTQIVGQIVDETGQLPIPSENLSNGPARNPAVAFNPERKVFFAAWRDGAGGAWFPAGRAIEWDGSSLHLRPADKIGTQGHHDGRPAVAASKDNFVVVWEVNDQGSFDPDNLFAATVRPDDSFSGEVELTKDLDQNYGGLVQAEPSVACRDEECLVLFHSHAQGDFADLWAMRLAVKPDPTPGSYQRAIVHKYDEGRPSVVFDGDQYAAMWETDIDGYPAVWFSRFDDAGNPLDGPDGIEVAPGTLPALTWHKPDRYLLVNRQSLRGVERAWATKFE